jgi:flagellar basal-body rod protein FlgG
MIEGLYSAASGMEAQQQRLDSIANDLANVDTTGFQSQRVGFEDLLYNGSGSAGASGVTVGAGSALLTLGPSQAAGPIQQTGRSLDVAISGDGYLQLRQANGSVALTRDGHLEVDAQGRLTDENGLLLTPPITMPAGVSQSDVQIGADGTITAAGKSIGRLALVTVPAPDQLTEASGNLLLPNAASGGVRAATNATVVQGALNGSNVDLASTMSQMIDAQQGYSLASRAINIEEQMGQIANGVKQ